MRVFVRRAGGLASILMIGFTTFWTYWGAGEMYHEGWWGAWYRPLPYLAPIALTLIPTLMAFRWPRLGGSLIIGVGVFAALMFRNAVAFIGLAIALVGLAFVAQGMVQRGVVAEEGGGRAEAADPTPWWRRSWRYALAIGLPALVFVGMSAYMLPFVLSRVDDGDRSARLIEGNDVALIWAPEGPGWNWKQDWGGFPSWQDIALYGAPPLGMDDKPGYGRQGEDDATIVFASEEDMARTQICHYLSRDGQSLMDAPQDIWRMPTTDELVRSLGRHGLNAGCRWQGEYREAVDCERKPDKESPLWSTDQPAIYYWTAESYDERNAYFVAFNGTVNATYKLGGNPRHSYRCVKAP